MTNPYQPPSEKPKPVPDTSKQPQVIAEKIMAAAIGVLLAVILGLMILVVM